MSAARRIFTGKWFEENKFGLPYPLPERIRVSGAGSNEVNGIYFRNPESGAFWVKPNSNGMGFRFGSIDSVEYGVVLGRSGEIPFYTSTTPTGANSEEFPQLGVLYQVSPDGPSYSQGVEPPPVLELLPEYGPQD